MILGQELLLLLLQPPSQLLSLLLSFFWQISLESYAQLGFAGASELANMFRFYRLKPDRDILLTLKLNPSARTFEEWMADQRDAFKDL